LNVGTIQLHDTIHPVPTHTPPVHFASENFPDYRYALAFLSEKSKHFCAVKGKNSFIAIT
jgi:hypothetical protein